MRKILFATALGVAALLALPNLSLAQRHGGGGGGTRSGGGYYGGNGGYYGGNGGYYNHGGYGYGAIGYGGLYGGYVGNGWGIGVGVPVGGYYNYGYGYRSPYSYGGYGYSSPYYGGYGYSSPYYGSSYSYSQPTAPATSLYSPSQSTLPAPTTTDNANTNVVNMEVRVPENATLYIQGQKSDATGTERRFVSGALEPGRKYEYELRATWMDANGKLVDRTKKVDVQAGAWVGVDMTQQ